MNLTLYNIPSKRLGVISLLKRWNSEMQAAQSVLFLRSSGCERLCVVRWFKDAQGMLHQGNAGFPVLADRWRCSDRIDVGIWKADLQRAEALFVGKDVLRRYREYF